MPRSSFSAASAFRGDHVGKRAEDVPEADVQDAAPLGRLFASWRLSWSSPLVRAIAASTAAMVFLRYGLKLLAFDALGKGFAGDLARLKDAFSDAFRDVGAKILPFLADFETGDTSQWSATQP